MPDPEPANDVTQPSPTLPDPEAANDVSQPSAVLGEGEEPGEEPGKTTQPYPICNLGPCPLPGGRVMFTSNRNGFEMPRGNNLGFNIPCHPLAAPGRWRQSGEAQAQPPPRAKRDDGVRANIENLIAAQVQPQRSI